MTDRMTLAEECHSRVCPHCRQLKADGKPFCFDCFVRLPARMRTDLFKRFGYGYAEAVAAAKEFLKSLPVMPGKEG